jgi:hypothetical protein
MSNLAKVWNDGPTDYTELFRDSAITIPKGQCIEMDRYEAAAFVSQYIKPLKTEVGGYKNHKMLRVEIPSDAPAAKVEHRCMLCKGLFGNETELSLHSEAFHKSVMVEADPKPKK